MASCRRCAARGAGGRPAQAAAAAASAPEPAAAVACPPAAVMPTRDAVIAAMRDATDHGPLWKASKDGRTVYLYGTIHVARSSWMYPGPHVMRAIQVSDAIALELDLTDPDILGRLQKAVLRTPESPVLPQALEQRLLANMAAACVARRRSRRCARRCRPPRWR